MTRFSDFNIDQGLKLFNRIKIYSSVYLDCEELYRILNESNIDEISIIRILCNKNDDQRQKIREKYKNLFNHVGLRK